MKINTILEKIDDKQLFVPAFQREYVWKREDAKQLIDSLIKDYPTGTMLTWETTNPPELKGLHQYSTQQGAVKLLLDGQQRITTLYMLIKGVIPPYYKEEDIIHSIMGLYVNLDSLELSYYVKTRMEDDPRWQNVTDILKRKVRPRDVIRSLETKGVEVTREYEDKIDDNTRSIELIIDREFPEQIIPPKARIREAIDIFYKVNSSGVALSEAELALAQISGYWPKARELFKNKLSELSKQGYVFKLDFIIFSILGCMYHIGSDMKKLHGAENLNDQLDENGKIIREGIQKVWEKLEKYILDYVMNLMRSRGYVDHTWEINSVFALIPVIVFCYQKHGETIPEQQLSRIIKWFYYSQIRSRYISQTPQKLDLDLRIIQGKERPFEELLGILEEEKSLEIKPEEFTGRSISHPLFGMMLWYLKSQDASCFTTGIGLRTNMGEKYKLENDHIFPFSVLKKHGYGRENRVLYSLAQEFTNRAILTQVANRRKSSKLAEDYLKEIKEKSPGALEKQCIPIDEDLWKVENYQDFLSARRKLLADKINQYLSNLATLSEEYFGEATLEELIKEGESSDLEFKSSLRWGSTDPVEVKKAQSIIMKAIAGFANADGGTLLMGVNDSGEAIGLDRDYSTLKGDKDNFELHLGGLIDNEFGKVFRANNIKILFPVVNDVEICQVDIKPTHDPKVLMSTNKNGQKLEKFYVRSGNSTQDLSMAEASEYIKSRFK